MSGTPGIRAIMERVAALAEEANVTGRCECGKFVFVGPLHLERVAFRAHVEVSHPERLSALAEHRTSAPQEKRADFSLLRSLDLVRVAAQLPTFLRGENSSLPVWLDRRRLLAKQQRLAAELVLETGNEAPNKTFGIRAGDERTARGVPILGYAGGVGGAIAGTRPDTANLDTRPIEQLLKAA